MKTKILILTILSLLNVTVMAAPDETSHRVCGELYDDEHPLSVQVFLKKYSQNTYRETVVDDIAGYLEKTPVQSDTAVRDKFLEELKETREDIGTGYVRFAIVKTGTLPIKQLLFAYTDRQIELPYGKCSDSEAKQLNELRYFAEIMRSIAFNCQTLRCK